MDHFTRVPMLPRIPSMAEVLKDSNKQRDNPAVYSFATVKKEVARFQSSLGDDYEMGMLMAGGIGAVHLRSIRPANPDLFIFDGLDEQQRDVTVVQHYSQVSLVLISLPKIEEKAHRIGFGIPGSEN